MTELQYNSKTSVELPTTLASEVIQKTQEQSAVMALARQVQLPGNGLSVPVILSDPEAEWVKEETAERKVSTGTLETKKMVTYALSVIVPFSNKFRRDASMLYNAIADRIPGVLAKKFDNTVFGGTDAPGENFDTFNSITQQLLTPETAYDGLVAADTDIAVHNGWANGYILSPQARGLMLQSKDNNGRPLFINSVVDGAIPSLLSTPVYNSRGAYVKGSTNSVVGVLGDWTKAVYGTVEGIKVTVSDQATVNNGSEQINLFQRDMFAIKAEIEVGFRADTSVFNALAVKNAE